MPTAKNKIRTRESALPKSKKKIVFEAHLGHPNKMFRFPSPRLLWWWVGRSGKKKKNEHLKLSGSQRMPGCYVRKPGYKVN